MASETLRSRPAGRMGTLSQRQRIIFVVALVIMTLASGYSCLALMTRITPALFPGKTIGSVSPKLGDLSGIGISPPSSQSVFNRRINLLIMGIDQRPNGLPLNATNTDTLMVASIDPASNQMSLLSIPRDLWVNINWPDGGVTQDRINSSFADGVQQGNTVDAGAQQLERDLKVDFGINIDYWMLLNFQGAEKLFDAIGGVDVTIPPELAVPNWFYSDDDIHGEWLSFPPGPTHLDGYHAVAFGRYRDTDSDLVRVKRQQLVLSAAVSKIRAAGLLNNPFQLWDAYSSLVQTNIPRAKLPGYALLIQGAQQQMRTYSLGDPVNGVPTVSDWTSPGGGAVLTWNPTNVQYWLNQAFKPSIYVGSHVEIRMANGTADDTQAVALGHYLEFKGLSGVELGAPDATQPDTYVQIVGDNDGRRQLASDIASWLQLPTSAVQVAPRTNNTDPDVIIEVGSSFQLPN